MEKLWLNVKVFEVAFSLFFACALYAVWSIQFGTAAGGVVGGAGSDSFIIVDRINHTSHWAWYYQSYLSQVGGQGVLLAGLFKLLNAFDVAYFALLSSNVFALLTALSVSVAVPFIYRNVGFFGMLLVFVLFASSRWMYSFAYSLYWVLFTLILPLTYSIACGGMMGAGRRPRHLFLLGLAFIVFLKSICGYEYITTLTILACAGYVVSTVQSKQGICLRSMIWIFAACLAGFSVAFLLHLVQLYAIHGWDGVHHIFGRILMHSGGDGAAGRADILLGRLQLEGGMQAAIDKLSTDLQGHQLLFFWLSFVQYFSIDALSLFSVKLSFGVFSILSGLAALRCVYVLIKRGAGQASPVDYPWALAAFLALLAALSWQVLAWKHMTIHYHLNGLVFFVGIVPLSSLWLLMFIKQAFGCSWVGPDVRYVLFALLAIVPSALLIGQQWAHVEAQARQLQFLAGNPGVEFVKGRLDKLEVQAMPRGMTGIEIPRGLGLASTRIVVGGWAFSSVAPAEIEVKVKGVMVKRLVPDGHRADVARIYPEGPVNTGYMLSTVVPSDIDLQDVEVWVVDALGNRLELTKRG